MSPGKRVCTLGRTTVLYGRLTNNGVSVRVGSMCPRPVRSFPIHLGCRCTRHLVNGRVNTRAVGDVTASLRVGVIGRSTRNVSLLIPTCHISIRHPYSIMRSVLHVCKCGGIRVPARLGDSLAIRNSRSGTCRDRGLITRRLMNRNFVRVLGGSLDGADCCASLRLGGCPLRGMIGIVGPLDTSLNIVHRAVLFNNLRDMTHGVGRGDRGLGFFRINGACLCGGRG